MRNTSELHTRRVLRTMRTTSAIVAICTFAAPALAQQAFERTHAPELSKAATLSVPPVVSTTAANGITVHVVEQHELPLVQIIASFDGGSRLDGQRPGIASFMAGMLDEGAGSRDAAALQSEIAFLGANLGVGTSWDAFTVSLKVPVRSIEPALDLMADVIMRPRFSSAEVRRQRDLRFAALLQSRDQPNALAALAFYQQLFPQGHPYHRSQTGDSASIMALDSASVRNFYAQTIRPERASFIVVGDIGAAEAKRLIESRFGSWRGQGTALAVQAVAARPLQRDRTNLFLVDKPQAAQSVITIGWEGVDRLNPDYAPLMVMNTLLGGSFTSRLNMNLRETHGYSYGARSGFLFNKAPGPFTASAAVRTNVTDSSLVEFFHELNRIRDSVVPNDELERAKAYIELRLPGSLEATSQVAGQLQDLQTFGLDLNELPRFASRVRGVTSSDVQRVARTYLHPSRATVVVVGDLSAIRNAVDALKLGPATEIKVAELVH